MSYNHNPRVVKDGLVLYLDAANQKSFTSTSDPWKDLSGNGNHGNFVNGPTYDSNNLGSISFDGTDDYVDCGEPFYNWTNGLSIGAWIFTNNSTKNMSIASKSKSSNREFHFRTDNGKPYIWVTDSIINLIGDFLIINNWYYILFTYNYNDIKLYVDGIFHKNKSSTTLINNNNSDLHIGKWAESTSYVFDGNISNVQIYNRALSEKEIKQNYNALKGRYGL